MDKGKKHIQRTVGRSKKSNTGLMPVILIFVIVLATVYVMNHYSNNSQEDPAVIETPNTNSTNLPQLAERYYGNSVFWIYIFEANREQLSSPVNIPAGIVLTVPNLENLGIDVKDSAEIIKAKVLANKLISEKRIFNQEKY